MTLDEAINHAKEVAEKARNDADSGYYDEDKCIECANEHEQLAEWLEDYKRLLGERPQGEYVSISKLRLMTVEECAGHTIDYAMGWKACIEWIMKGGAE